MATILVHANNSCEWIKIRQSDLMKDWDLAKEGKPVYPVSPLE